MELTKMPNKLFTKKILGTLNPQEDAELQKQMEQNPDVLREFRMTSKIWEEAAKIDAFIQVNPKNDWNAIRRQVEPELQNNYKKIPLGIYFVRIAALVMLTGGLSFGFYKFMITHKAPETGFTSYDSKTSNRNVILPDGSSVVLKNGSSITFRDGFGTTSRDIILQGEAFFSVIPGLALPFRVYSGQSVVEVTGTQFTVSEKAGSVLVNVISGTVILSSKADRKEKISIKANESGCLTNNNELFVEKGIPVNALSWKTGHLTFEHTPIDSALMDIAEHFNKNLIIRNNLNDKITAEFQDQPLQEILEELKIVAGLEFDTTATALVVRK